MEENTTAKDSDDLAESKIEDFVVKEAAVAEKDTGWQQQLSEVSPLVKYWMPGIFLLMIIIGYFSGSWYQYRLNQTEEAVTVDSNRVVSEDNTNAEVERVNNNQETNVESSREGNPFPIVMFDPEANPSPEIDPPTSNEP